MGTRDVAAHILAKIDGIVQSGALEDEGPAPVPPGMSAGSTTTATIQSKAVQRIRVYCEVLNAVAGYAAVESKPQEAGNTVAENKRPPSNFRQ
jgi:hypothetical protein